MPGVPFALPASWSAGRPGGPARLIVIHFTAGSEGLTAAEDGAAYDRKRTDGTSCHFFTDGNSIFQEVDTNDRSHSALYNGNLFGIHIEQCGTKQTRAQWLDELSRPMITNTARVCAWAMAVHKIPLVRLVNSQVRSGRGLCGHADITHGYPEDGGTHEDPGAEYPWDVLFEDILAIQKGEIMQVDPITIDDDISKLIGGYLKTGQEQSFERIFQILFWKAYSGANDAYQARKTADQLAVLVANLTQQSATNGAAIVALQQQVANLHMSMSAEDRQAIIDGLAAVLNQQQTQTVELTGTVKPIPTAKTPPA